MKLKKLFLIIPPLVFFGAILFFLPRVGGAEENGGNLHFSAEDRVLILAPHPDDEAIALAGIVQQAVTQKLPLKIVYLTHGDNNELAFIVYKKRPVLARKLLLQMGELRRKESVEAMKFLGVEESQLVFLGYPDFGTMHIFLDYWGKENKPFRSMLTKVTNVPYHDSLSFGAPYIGDSILEDLEKTILDFKPTKIFVSHPGDSNVDHRSLYLFTRIALWNLDGGIPIPQVLPYLVHVKGWPLPRGFHPEKRLDVPESFKKIGLTWIDYNLTPEELQRKKQAIEFFKSQIKYNPPYLFTFARANEMLSIFPEILLKDEVGENDEWDQLATAQKLAKSPSPEEKTQNEIAAENVEKLGNNGNIGAKGEAAAFDEVTVLDAGMDAVVPTVTYAKKNKNLYLKFNAKDWEKKVFSFSFYLMGYKKDIPFTQMPKYRFVITRGNKLTIYDRRNKVVLDNVDFLSQGGNLYVRVPLSVLNDPQYILTCLRAGLVDFTFEATSWRILKLE